MRLIKNKVYALIDVLTTLTCMVMIASDRMSISMRVESRNEINECAKKIHGQMGAMRSKEPS